MAELVATKKVPDIIKPFELERFYKYQQINAAGATAASH
jgi:sarcosine oxidase subunit beta